MSAEHGRVVTTDMFTQRRPRRAYSSGRLLLIRKRSATKGLTRGHPGASGRAAGRRPWLASHPAPAQARRFRLADLLAFST